MPELPEVETIRRVLEPQLTGQKIVHVALNNPRVIAHPSAEDFCRLLPGQTIAGMNRRGKFLILPLSDGSRVVLHLRMTGCLLVMPAAEQQERHTHVVISLEDGRELRFEDIRRFGRFWLLQKGEADECTGMGRLGIEPFDPVLTAGYLQKIFGHRKKAVKECLLDQHGVCGIGNIYADEILFAAKIHPRRPADTLTQNEWRKLAEMIPERLRYFVEKNAITAEEYLRSKGKEYRNTPFLRVYAHAGESCPCCGQTLQKMVIGGRSSVYCPCCQKEEA